MGEYDTIRENLTSRYDEIQSRLIKIMKDRRHVNQPLEKDFAEQATETENDEVLDALDLKIRAAMEQIEKRCKQQSQQLHKWGSAQGNGNCAPTDDATNHQLHR